MAERGPVGSVASEPNSPTGGPESGDWAQDPYLGYDGTVRFPPITVDSAESLRHPLRGIASLRLSNLSDFAYEASLGRSPSWLLADDQRVVIPPGEERTLTLSVDPAAAPPGSHVEGAELVLRQAFFKRVYPLNLVCDIRYTTPAPDVLVHAVEDEGLKTLRMQVRNVGGGLLQGYCYDRSANKWLSFLLPGESSADPAELPGRHSHGLFLYEKSFHEVAAARSGVLILCDCVNERLRSLRVLPQEHFAREPLFEEFFVDFMRVRAGRPHLLDLTLARPTSRTLDVGIPPELCPHLSCVRISDRILRVNLEASARELGPTTVSTLKVSLGERRSGLPVMISFLA